MQLIAPYKTEFISLSQTTPLIRHFVSPSAQGIQGHKHRVALLFPLYPTIGEKEIICAKHDKNLSNYRLNVLENDKTHLPSPPLGEGKGFTLAEVLITLGIIGVVAVLTIPSLIEKHKEKVTIARVKQSYSILNQAFNMAVNENGPLNNWDIETFDKGGCGPCAIQFTEILVKYMKRVEKCYGSSVGTDADGNPVYDKGENVKCGGTDRARPLRLDGSDSPYGIEDLYVSTNFAKSILANGTYISNSKLSSTYRGTLYLDINGGKQKPNQFGIDLFMFEISPDGIHPHGMGNKALVDRECNKNSEGKTCAAWILMYDNMDYLRK